MSVSKAAGPCAPSAQRDKGAYRSGRAREKSVPESGPFPGRGLAGLARRIRGKGEREAGVTEGPPLGRAESRGIPRRCGGCGGCAVATWALQVQASGGTGAGLDSEHRSRLSWLKHLRLSPQL